MTEKGTGWTSLTQSGVVVSGPSLLYGITMFSTNSNKQISLYDGIDAGSGRLVFNGASGNKWTVSVQFNKPLRMDSGIYVTLEANVDHVLVSWEAR